MHKAIIVSFDVVQRYDTDLILSSRTLLLKLWKESSVLDWKEIIYQCALQGSQSTERAILAFVQVAMTLLDVLLRERKRNNALSSVWITTTKKKHAVKSTLLLTLLDNMPPVHIFQELRFMRQKMVGLYRDLKCYFLDLQAFEQREPSRKPATMYSLSYGLEQCPRIQNIFDALASSIVTANLNGK